MLDLASERWGELTDAYGPADAVPALLAQLSSFPAETGSRSEPWFSLWSRLCHQGDIYPASFAAVPHILGAAAIDPIRASFNYFLLPAAIELARNEHQTDVPSDLRADYHQALDGIPALAAKAAARPWDADFCQAILAAIAASRTQYNVATLLTDIEPQDIMQVLEWYRSR